jgi:hypothetical protein
VLRRNLIQKIANVRAFDFASNLRGDGDEKDMQIQRPALGAAFLAACVVAAANYVTQRYLERGDNNTSQIVGLRADVNNLIGRFDDFSKQPFVRREEFNATLYGVETRISNVEQRLGNVERAQVERK